MIAEHRKYQQWWKRVALFTNSHALQCGGLLRDTSVAIDLMMYWCEIALIISKKNAWWGSETKERLFNYFLAQQWISCDFVSMECCITQGGEKEWRTELPEDTDSTVFIPSGFYLTKISSEEGRMNQAVLHVFAHFLEQGWVRSDDDSYQLFSKADYWRLDNESWYFTPDGASRLIRTTPGRVVFKKYMDARRGKIVPDQNGEP